LVVAGIGGAIAVGGFVLSHGHSVADFPKAIPGMIYLTETKEPEIPVPSSLSVPQEEGTPAPTEGAGQETPSGSEEVKGENPAPGSVKKGSVDTAQEVDEKEDRYTFYNTLPSKKEEIVPLTSEKTKARDRGPIVFPPMPAEKKSSEPQQIQGITPTLAGNLFTVQVAAMKERANAEELMTSLKAKGHDAYMTALSAENRGTLYRIRIGHYGNRKEAQRMADGLSREGLNPFVVNGE
jgi:cell division septation protein DedD